MIGNKITDKVTKTSSTSPQKNSKIVTNEHDKEIPREIYISPEQRRQKVINNLRLI